MARARKTTPSEMMDEARRFISALAWAYRLDTGCISCLYDAAQATITVNDPGRKKATVVIDWSNGSFFYTICSGSRTRVLGEDERVLLISSIWPGRRRCA